MTTPAGGLIEYDPSAGSFVWVKVTSNRAKVGAPAGSVRPDGYRVLPCGTRAHVAACKAVGVDVPAGAVVDHINGNVADNRIANLRVTNRKVNAHNTGIRSTNHTGVRGVSWDAKRGKYRAALLVDGKQYSKRFDTLGEAGAWYTTQAKLHSVYEYQR